MRATQVVNASDGSTMQDDVKSARNVLHVEVVARIVSVPVERHLGAAAELIDKFRNQLFGELEK